MYVPPLQIRVRALGLEQCRAYIAHEFGKWGPEIEGSDFKKHPLRLSGDDLVCDGNFLKPNEEFKIVIPSLSEEEAHDVHVARCEALARETGAGVMVHFDYDRERGTYKLTADSHPVIRPGQWNANNVNAKNQA